MRLFAFINLVTVVAFGEENKPPVQRYGIDGWDDHCEFEPSCKNHQSDGAYLTKDLSELKQCLDHHSPKCNNLKVHLYVDNVETFYKPFKDHIKTLVIKVKKTLYPSPWVLSEGTVMLLPAQPEIDGGTIMFKEGPIADFSKEDTNTWTPLKCQIKVKQKFDHLYSFSCPDETHRLLSSESEINFVIKKNGKSILYEFTEGFTRLPIVNMVFNRSQDVFQVQEIIPSEHIRYNLYYVGREGCSYVPKECNPPKPFLKYADMTFEHAKNCLDKYKVRNTCPQIRLLARIDGPAFRPSMLRVGDKHVFIPAIFIDLAKVVFAKDVSPPIEWFNDGTLDSSFHLNMTGTTKIFLSEKFGDFAGASVADYDLSANDILLNDPIHSIAFDYTKRNGSYIYVNQSLPENFELYYVGALGMEHNCKDFSKFHCGV